MAHISEDCSRLEKEVIPVVSLDQLNSYQSSDANVYLFYFPFGRTDFDASRSNDAYEKIGKFCSQLPPDATVCILTTPPDAARILPFLEQCLEYSIPHCLDNGGYYICQPTTLFYVFQKGNPGRFLALPAITRLKKKKWI